jgi:hypothetical protein
MISIEHEQEYFCLETRSFSFWKSNHMEYLGWSFVMLSGYLLDDRVFNHSKRTPLLCWIFASFQVFLRCFCCHIGFISTCL